MQQSSKGQPFILPDRSLVYSHFRRVEEVAKKNAKLSKKAKSWKDQVGVVEGMFMESFTKCTSFDFDDSSCTIELQVSGWLS